LNGRITGFGKKNPNMLPPGLPVLGAAELLSRHRFRRTEEIVIHSFEGDEIIAAESAGFHDMKSRTKMVLFTMAACQMER
jgi:hypothetical protein